MEVNKLAKAARLAAGEFSSSSYETRHAALTKMAGALLENMAFILEENKKDMAAAQEAGISAAILDRLRLDEKRIRGMADGILGVHDQRDILGEALSMEKRPNGLTVAKIRVPIGVVAMIYEARPNVTADAAALAVKTGNAIILRGGKEAINSNKAIVKVLCEATKDILPEGTISLVTDTSRESATELMRQNGLVDVLIPRGGAGLIKSVVENATVPVIETGVGNCHVYIDASADYETAEKLVVNAKTQRPGVCNAAESLLVDRACAKEVIPKICRALNDAGVTLYGSPEVISLYPMEEADEKDYYMEYLDMKMSVCLVDGVEGAIRHINKYGTHHSDAIVTNDYGNAQRFLAGVDSAAVYVNASTRFTDGGEFGYGAEIGISTQKMHARGPMGQEALTTTKFIIYGSGQIR